MNATRRSLLLGAAGSAGIAACPWQPALMPVVPTTAAAGVEGDALLVLAGPQYANAFIGAVQRVARLPVERFGASPLDAVALARWLGQRPGAVGIGLLSAAEHVFVNEAFRLAGSRLLSTEGPLAATEVAQPRALAALRAAAQTVDPGTPSLVPLIFIA